MQRSSLTAAGMFALACVAQVAWAADPAPAAATAAPPKTQFTSALDPYDSNLALDIPLTHKPIPLIQSENPTVLFEDLMADSLIPHYMYLQGDVYPVPVLGTWLKSHSPHTYKKADLQDTGVNLVESSTTTYQDPWAMSVFFGNIANLQRPNQPQGSNNVGYCGWLLSGGTQHLKDNVLIQDDWYRVEWQIRGDLDDPIANFAWDFRIGSKFNANPYITDVTYIGIQRNDLDLRRPFLSWLDNSYVNLQVELSQHSGRVVRDTFVVGKKYPFPESGYAVTLNVGVVWDGVDEYSGPLRDSQKSQYTLVFQPSIEF